MSLGNVNMRKDALLWEAVQENEASMMDTTLAIFAQQCCSALS